MIMGGSLSAGCCSIMNNMQVYVVTILLILILIPSGR